LHFGSHCISAAICVSDRVIRDLEHGDVDGGVDADAFTRSCACDAYTRGRAAPYCRQGSVLRGLFLFLAR
jgi:hypothetical protein